MTTEAPPASPLQTPPSRGRAGSPGLRIPPILRSAALGLVPLLAVLSQASCGGGGGGGGGVQPPSSDIPATIRNLIRAASQVRAGDGFIAFSIPEASQDNTDLNFDGDANDDVVHFYDVADGSVVNCGVALVGEIHTSGRRAVFLVRESAQDLDLNGDGDLQDDVLHTFDADTGVSPPTGFAATPDFVLEGSRVAFHVREASQGQDLNGDGDLEDDLLHVHDLVSTQTTNLGVALGGDLVRDGDVLAAIADESATLTDLNGDGDMADLVMHVVDLALGTVTNLELALGLAAGGDPGTTHVGGAYVAFFVGETAQGEMDLNGNGTSLDFVLHVHDVRTGLTDNLQLVNVLVAGDDQLFAVLLTELSTGTDLNGDGDIFDFVLHVAAPTTFELDNLGLATSEFLVRDGAIVFTVGEFFQGEDLNGDGDVADDVLHVYDAASGEVTSLGISALDPGQVLGGTKHAFRTSEANEGLDLNDDGDVRPEDMVLHVLDLATLEVTNLALAAEEFEGNSQILAFTVRELSQGGADLNRDGDIFDPVLFVHVFSTGETGNLRFAGRLSGETGRPDSLSGNVLLMRVAEFEQGTADFNFDGDDSDFVVHEVIVEVEE